MSFVRHSVEYNGWNHEWFTPDLETEEWMWAQRLHDSPLYLKWKEKHEAKKAAQKAAKRAEKEAAGK